MKHPYRFYTGLCWIFIAACLIATSIIESPWRFPLGATAMFAGIYCVVTGILGDE